MHSYSSIVVVSVKDSKLSPDRLSLALPHCQSSIELEIN